MIAWQSKECVFVGSKVTLVLTHDSTEGEVRSKVLGSLFLKIFPVINLSSKSEHEKPFLIIKSNLNNNTKSK